MDKPANPSPLLRRLIASAFFMDTGFFLVLAAIPYKVLDLGGGAVALGLAPATSSITYVVLTLIAGRWSDRYGRYRLALWGSGLFLVFSLFASQARGLSWLIAMMPLLGCGAALYWPLVQAAVGDLAGGAGLARALGMFNVSWSAGKALGFWGGGLLLDRAGLTMTFLAGAALVALSFLCLPWRRLPAGSDSPAGGDDTPRGEGVPEARRQTLRRMAWLANAAAYGAGGVLNHQLPKWFSVHGWDPDRFGLFLGVVFLSQTVTFAVLAGRWRLRDSASRLLVPQLGAAAAMVALPLFGRFGALLALAPFIGLAFGVCYAGSIYYSLQARADRGRNAGIHESLIGVGNFTMPLFGGLAARASGWLGAPYLLAAGGIVGALVVQFAWWRKRGGV